MPTYIKTGFWEKLKQGSKEWLNLDNLITKIISETPSTGVQSVTGYGVDNTDPLNPIIVAPYKVYTALLTNSSGTITAIQLENTIGDGSGDGTNDIAWTNPSNGIIRGTMSAGTPFPTNKTWAVSPTLDQSSNAYFVGNKPYNFAPNNSYDFVIRLHDNTQSSTPNFTNLSIEIRVYN